jgi:hypothetical protein
MTNAQALKLALAEVDEVLAEFELYFSGCGWTQKQIAEGLGEIAESLPVGSTVRKKVCERLDVLTVGDNMLH